jgi:PAS domain S-box-containing protein
MTIAYGFFAGGKNITTLKGMSSMDFKAFQLSMKSLKEFEEEIKLYQDMVNTGDIGILPMAGEKAEQLENTLDRLEGFIQDIRTKKEVGLLMERLSSFHLAAPSVYIELRKNPSEFNVETVGKATRLAVQWKGIRSDLENLKDRYAGSINSNLISMGERIRKQWIVSGLIFVLGVGSSLVFIFFIVVRFIRNPMKKTIDAFSTGAMGDFSVRLDGTGNDEIGQLASYFNTFMEKLEIYNRNLHEEIANHRISAENLRKSEELYTRLVNTIPEIVLRSDLEGTVLFVNDFTKELTGYRCDELIGQNLINFVSPEDYDRVSHNLMTLDTGQAANEYKLLKKDGSSFYVDVGSDALRDEDGKAFGRVYVCRDITPRKLAEQERAKLQEQLIQSQKMESVGRLAGGVAHDFNNMLSIIIGNAEMALQDMKPAGEFYPAMQQILSAGERSADLTRQLLAFARKQKIGRASCRERVS